MNAPRARRVVGFLMLVIFAFLAAASFLTGITLDGKEHPTIQCGHATTLPAIGGPFYENTIIAGERTFMPLGVNCSYDSPDDTVGPQTVVNSNWSATLVWLASTAIALCGATILVHPEALTKGRIESNA